MAMFSRNVHIQDHNTHDREKEKIPAALVKAIGALLVLVLALVTAMRVMGIQPASTPPVAGIAQEQVVRIVSRSDGGVIVSDAATGAVIADLPIMEGGFVAGVWRAVLFDRGRNTGADLDAPLRIVRWDDGRLSLIDPQSDWRMELWGFGETNYEAFAALMPGAE